MIAPAVSPQGNPMPDILSKQNGPILEITLNRPERGNGADDAMAIELTRLIENVLAGTACIVLRGAGADFCTGRVQSGPPPTGPGNAFAVRQFFEAVFKCYGAIRNSPVPVIAVVQGRALGFGCAIAAVADITMVGRMLCAISGTWKVAASLAIVMSATAAIAQPNPSARPCTTAMTGTGELRIAP